VTQLQQSCRARVLVRSGSTCWLQGYRLIAYQLSGSTCWLQGYRLIAYQLWDHNTAMAVVRCMYADGSAGHVDIVYCTCNSDLTVLTVVITHVLLVPVLLSLSLSLLIFGRHLAGPTAPIPPCHLTARSAPMWHSATTSAATCGA
jgi:hypothetical protein